MRVAFYTRPSYLDTALPYIREVSQRVELHVLLELSPEQLRTGLFDAAPRGLNAGLVPADPVLSKSFPPGVVEYWKHAATFNFVVHNNRRSLHPATWWVSHQAVRFLNGLRPDILHQDDPSLRFSLALPELSGPKMVMTIHDPEAHSGEQGNWRGRLTKGLTFGRTARFILRNGAQESGFRARNRLAPSRVSVIPLGELSIFRHWIAQPEEEDERNVLFFGRLSPYKGLETLYEAVPRVAKLVEGVRLVVAGRAENGYTPPSPPDMPNGGSVELVDEYIPNRRLAELFQQASIVVCPYTDATQSGVVLTAYGFDKPVVATRVGGLPEYVLDGQTGALVPSRDPEALAAALARVLTDRAMRLRLRAGVREISQTTLSWSTIADKALETYRQVLADGH